MSDSLSLFRLQKLDSQIRQIKLRLAQIEKVLNDDSRIMQAQKIVDSASNEEKKILSQLKKIEDKVEAQRQKRSLGQAALFGGKIKNPKELQDLEMESDALKRSIELLEDQQLILMIEHEGAVEIFQRAKQSLTKVKETVLQENSLLMGEKSSLIEKLKRSIREKDATNHAISESSLALYENLRDKKNGIAVVTVVEGSCGVCGQSITPADQQRIRTSSALVYCPSCGRILFIE